MGRPRKVDVEQKREAELAKRAAARNYTIEKEDGKWYAAIGGTRWGPMTLEGLDEFLPAAPEASDN